MKKLFLSIVTLCVATFVSAQDIVTLTVIGQGATKEIATSNALRSAIEQAFGVFVSANTQILNDALVKDEIATVSSGNIQQYTEASCVQMPNGEFSVTLSATVAIGKLVAYAKSHGSSAEFAGQTFAMNMKMLELNKQNEKKALEHTLLQLKVIAEHMFDWNLEVGSPIAAGDNYSVSMKVTAISNEASDVFYKTLLGTLRSLSLTSAQITDYQSMNIETYPVTIKSYNGEYDNYWYRDEAPSIGSSRSVSDFDRFSFQFRSPDIYRFIKSVYIMLNRSARAFEIKEMGTANHAYSFIERRKQLRCYENMNIARNDRERIYWENMAKAAQLDEYTFFEYNERSYYNSGAYMPEGALLIIYHGSKYALKLIHKKKSLEPVVYRNNVFSHNVTIDIEKERIGSIRGFEVANKSISD